MTAGRCLIAVVAAVVIAGCREPEPFVGTARLAEFTQFGVAVNVELTRASRSTPLSLCGRFTPERAGFHMYAMELPDEGIRGIGRPTRLRLMDSAALRPTGAVVADKSPMQMKVVPLGLTFPVYPEGAVTLCMPVTIGDGTDRTAELAVTYMTCSDQVCMPPVENRRIAVSLADLTGARRVR